MNSKDKAKELFDKMFEPNNHYMNKNIEIDKIIAIHNALIAVEEISQHCYEVMKPFWEEVKQELELL
jgi:hypothetical protein